MKTIFLAPLLYGFSSVVADMSNFQRALKSVDTQSVIDRIKARTLAVEPNDLASAGDNEDEDCETLQGDYYNNTAIMAASPSLFFFFVEEWKEQSFDLDSFFEDMNFDNECESMGGIVEKVDANFFCSDYGDDDEGDDGDDGDDPESDDGEVKGVLKEFRLCRPPVCSDLEYFPSLEIMFAFAGFFAGCEISVDTGGRHLSLACLQGLEDVYNTTGLEGTSLLEFLDDDLEGFVTEECTPFSDEDILFVCRMEKFKEEQASVSEACEGGELGTILPLDFRLDTIDAHVTFTRYPQCVPKTCTNDEIMLYYDAVSRMIAEESGEGFYYDFQKSTINSCDEYNRDMAFMKKKVDGNVVDKTCKWLRNGADPLVKDKYCKKEVSFGDYGPARDVCPITCCTCEEKGENLFLKKAHKNKAGLLKIVHKDCNWLKSIPEDRRRFHCEKKAASYLGGYPPAADACPETCGTCISQE